jgi:prevent-host-death family protein
MKHWMTGEAKQQLSEVLRRSVEEPQEIFRRDRLVAAVISAEDYREFSSWREERARKTLGEAFDQVRELFTAYDYELDTGSRRNRDTPLDETD